MQNLKTVHQSLNLELNHLYLILKNEDIPFALPSEAVLNARPSATQKQ